MDKRENLFYALILILAGATLCYGWKLFWFLTDDAFISFRYISNWTLGYGPVWNPPPFRPVEGYTNFLWLALLYAIWQILGIAPPQAANYLALLFALGSLYLSSRMLMRLPLSAPLRPYRLVFLALLLLGTTTNRTFLAWSSSGLETAMFTFFIFGLDLCLRPGPTRSQQMAPGPHGFGRCDLSHAPRRLALPRCHPSHTIVHPAHGPLMQ